MKPEEKTTQDRHLSILVEMTDYIVDEVSSAALMAVDPNWDDFTETMLLTLYFSIGTNEYRVTIDWMGTIYDYSPKMPKHLLVSIHNGICTGYLRGIMDQLLASKGK